MGNSEIVSFRIAKKILEELDRLVKQGYFKNRSEAINEGIRLILNERCKHANKNK
jgi:Arc/MetJ-type ribon-helix-helix transcriptional regulator